MRRRRFPLMLLAAAVLLAGCFPKTPPPAVPTQPPAQSPPPPAAEAPPEPKPDPEPAPLLSLAPEGSLRRIQIAPGEPIGRSGLFFMQVATGEIEGWVLGEAPFETPRAFVSPDNRWIHLESFEAAYLADRQGNVVYRWSTKAGSPIAARGDLVLLMGDGRLWLGRGELTRLHPLEVTPTGQPEALIAPDGESLVLLNGGRLYLIEAEGARVREIGGSALTGEHAGGYLITDQLHQAIIVMAGGRLHRYSWQGSLLDSQPASGVWAYLSPDGARIAWRDSLLDLTDTLTIGTLPFQPQLRLLGEQSCTLPQQGPYWLPDSSGLLVSTTRGPRLLKLDGTLAPLFAGHENGSLPVPAPDRADLFAIGSLRVVDGSGKELASAVPFAPGATWVGIGSVEPWGDRSDEVRFHLRSGGRGFDCSPAIFPPVVEPAPFPEMVGLQVKVAADDCVNLRQSHWRESPVITCVPNGTRLVGALPRATNYKGELRWPWSPFAENMGDEWWWYVRTEQGERGWVYLSGEYLTWLPADPDHPVPDPAQALIEDLTAEVRFWLRVGLGEEPCGSHCGDTPTLGIATQGVIGWCEGGLGALRSMRGFDPARHGPSLSPLEAACTDLLAARQELGPLGESPAWRQKAREIVARLNP